MSEEKQPEKKNISVAYGALDMRSGDKITRGIAQVRKISEQKPYAWFFDIICTPNQIENARTNVAAIYGEITEKNETMPLDKIVVGITVSENLLPAKTIMQRLSEGVKADEDLTLGMSKYFEEKRLFLWIGGQNQHPVYEDESAA